MVVRGEAVDDDRGEAHPRDDVDHLGGWALRDQARPVGLPVVLHPPERPFQRRAVERRLQQVGVAGIVDHAGLGEGHVGRWNIIDPAGTVPSIWRTNASSLSHIAADWRTGGTEPPTCWSATPTTSSSAAAAGANHRFILLVRSAGRRSAAARRAVDQQADHRQEQQRQEDRRAVPATDRVGDERDDRSQTAHGTEEEGEHGHQAEVGDCCQAL